MKNSAVLLISCPDRKGIVATIADFVFQHDGNILHADEHADGGSNLFLMRVEFDPTDFDFDLADFSHHFSPIAKKYEMSWRLALTGRRKKMIILVSKYDHCLVDLLYRHHSGELNCDVPLVISNHPDNKPIADFYRIPYETVAVTKDNKREAEARILALLKQHDPDFIVLARYMQILSNEFVNQYPHRIINIHHSFLPAFVGAKPYHQAFERGVKLIGATSHFHRGSGRRSHHRAGRGSHLPSRLPRRSAAEGPRPRKSRPLPWRALAYRKPHPAVWQQDGGFRLGPRSFPYPYRLLPGSNLHEGTLSS
jgi:formyltetrahydrofolate deformylase